MAKRTRRKTAKKSAKSKKKPQKKKAQKKKAQKAAAPVRFKYFCASGTCKVQPRIGHLAKNSAVVLWADRTIATLDFTPFGASPFQSGVLLINLAAGEKRTEMVGSNAGTFEYKLSCGSCSGQPSAPPKMIVDP
jgi:hypothetical protein